MGGGAGVEGGEGDEKSRTLAEVDDNPSRKVERKAGGSLELVVASSTRRVEIMVICSSDRLIRTYVDFSIECQHLNFDFIE